MGDTASQNPLQRAIDEHMGQQMAMPIAHYEELFSKVDPRLTAARCGVAYASCDEEEGGSGVFELSLIGRPVGVDWPSMAMSYRDTGEALPDKARIILAELLLNGQLVPGTGKFIPYTDVPWGDHYFKAFQGRCLMRLAYMFKSAADFADAAEKVGGTRVAGGDASYEFDFVGGVMMRLTLWEADEEFPPSSQILFSDNAPMAFSAEDLAVAGDLLLGKLKAARG